MTNSKQKRRRIVGIAITVLLLIPFIYLGLLYYADKLKYKKIENYYYADTERFDSIVKYFETLYMEDLYGVEYNCNNSYLELKLRHTEANGEIDYTTKNVECADASFLRELSELREKYQKYCDYPVFSTIEACYDKEGNMLLYVQVYNEKISMEEKRGYYLVYVKEEYRGNSSFIGIDTLGRVTKTPFTDNWYTWSKDWPFG